MKSGIVGVGGAVDDARTEDVDEAPTPPDAVASAVGEGAIAVHLVHRALAEP